MLRRLVLVSTSVIAFTAAANAADMYRAPESAGGYKDGPAYVGVNWSGFYAGVNGGYAWDASSIGDQLGVFDISPAGGFGGGQIGYNFQRGNIVFGIEADIQGADISDAVTKSVMFDKTPVSITVKSSLDYFGTVRGRLGYAFDRTLVYATGGFAFGHITDELSGSVTIRDRTFTAAIEDETTSTGYVVGGGIEHKFSPAWSVKGEYQYINLGQDSGWANFTGEDYALHTVRVGLNYHVGSTYEPLK